MGSGIDMRHLKVYVIHCYQEAQELTDKSGKKCLMSSPAPKVVILTEGRR